MDNSAQWSTPLSASGGLLLGGVVLVVAAIASTADPGGLVIMGVAGVLLLLMGVSTVLLRPRLAADTEGVHLRTLLVRGSFRREEIGRIRVVSTPRLGRRVPTLEFDLPGDRLVVLGRWDLGAHPDDVAERLGQLGFPVTAGR